MNYKLTIGWLYPDLMSTYGDRGNIIVLQKRCEWRSIDVEIKRIGLDTKSNEIELCDLLFMGGAQDKQQEIVNKDLLDNKGKHLKFAIEKGTPGLFICGAYQFMGKYYRTAEGAIIKGLSIFDIHTENPGENHKRLIGNIVVKIHDSLFMIHDSYLVGFENHGGRTYLGENVKSLGEVIAGYGNNGNLPSEASAKDGDKTEGIIYKNSIGTYMHGPILPKNPELADHLIKKALEIKYKKEIALDSIDNRLEIKAKEAIVRRYSNNV